MKNMTTTSLTQIPRVRFASPQAADRSLDLGARGGSSASMNASAASYAPAAKDVAYLRSRRPPV